MQRILAIIGAVHILIDVTILAALWLAYRNAPEICDDWRTDGRI